MRRVVLQEFVTLDGLAAGPNDNVDFVPASTRGDRTFGKEQLKAKTHDRGTVLLKYTEDEARSANAALAHETASVR